MKEKLVNQILFCVISTLIVILMYLVGFHLITKHKALNMEVTEDSSITRSITSFADNGNKVSLSGWVLRQNAINTDIKVVLETTDGSKNHVLNTKQCENEGINKYFSDTWNYGKVSFDAEFDADMLEKEACYKIFCVLEYKEHGLKYETKVSTGKYLYNGEVYNYNPLEYVPLTVNDRAGVHVVCNMYMKTGKYNGDIMGKLSYGAVKIQLWHGIGVKACGMLTNQSKAILPKEQGTLLKKVKELSILSPGGWKNAYFAASSEEGARLAKDDYGYKEDRIFLYTPDRLTGKVNLLNEELRVVVNIKDLIQKGKKIVLYLPTFREHDNGEYINPSDMNGFEEFIANNNVAWIEKRHTASTYSGNYLEGIYYISDSVDINTIYDYIDVLITDYSSASSDCIYKHIPVVSFIPDFKYYRDEERGFVADYNLYNPGIKVYKNEELFGAITRACRDDFFDREKEVAYSETVTLLYRDNKASIESETEKLLNLVMKTSVPSSVV